jgi:hypothetical protein
MNSQYARILDYNIFLLTVWKQLREKVIKYEDLKKSVLTKNIIIHYSQN